MAINKLNTAYYGKFTIEIYDNVSTDFLTEALIPFSKDGNMVTIHSGSAKQSMGAIQMYSNSKSFYFAYSNMKRILSSKGEVLWENWNEEKK